MPRRSSSSSSSSEDTIAALSSPPGAGLRAVVRLSGPRAIEIAASLPGAVAFPGPRSFTREDVVEVHLPSSPPLVGRLLRELLARGARPARPGEFTLRAFLNGRLDLAQAEAVGRLVASEDQEERRAALEQLEGAFSRRLRDVESGLFDLCADAEAAIDFAGQDIEILPVGEAVRRAAAALADLRALLSETRARRVPDARPVVALYGRPNAGKTSLFTALAGTDAIVSDAPGTTRDVLAADVDLGLPVRLLDAAGDGSAEGLEGEAARRAREAARSADLVLFTVDAADWEPALPLEPRGRPAILVVSKCDLAPGEPVRTRFHIRDAVFTSARTGRGLDDLRRAVAAALGRGQVGPGGRFRVDLRQRSLLLEAEGALERAAGLAPALGMEFAALDLRAALDALGAITGRNVGEDLLDRIFSRFCLGK